MIDKGKISAFQMGIMMYPTIIATAVLFVPAITAKHAERDMWLSPIWGSLIGFLIVYLACRLNKIYPKETIIQYSEHILGRIPGKVIGFAYLFFYLHFTGIILREYADLVLSSFLIKTPVFVILGGMILVCAFAVRGGVEVLGRAAQLFVPIFILFVMLAILMLLPDMKMENMVPVMGRGIMPSVIGAVSTQSWFSEFFLISFLLPHLTDRAKGVKWGMISLFAVMLTLVFINMFILFIFGGITSTLTYPALEAVRWIAIAQFLEHVESVVMSLWVAITFVKISVFFYALAVGTAQWLKLSDYRPVVLPLGLLLVLSGIWSAPNLQELVHFLGTSGSFYLTSVQTAIPLFLLLVSVIRKGNRQEEQKR